MEYVKIMREKLKISDTYGEVPKALKVYFHNNHNIKLSREEFRNYMNFINIPIINAGIKKEHISKLKLISGGDKVLRKTWEIYPVEII